MAFLKNNIWLIFVALVISCFLLLAGISVTRWQGLNKHYLGNQDVLAQSWYGSFSSLLDQQEGIITLLGEKLLREKQAGNSNVQADLDSIMALNPDVFAGFALISKDGVVLELTSNLVSDNLPNLLEVPQTRDSFSYAMATNKMVLGRTYFAPRLVVPARKAIHSDQGELLGVMTGALKLGGSEGFFGRIQALGDFQRITVLRSRDRYLQYAGSRHLLPQFHQEPLSEYEYQSFLADLTANSGDITTAKKNKNGVRYTRTSMDGRGVVHGITIYHPRFEFWLTSEIERSFLIAEFLHIFAAYLATMLLFQLFMYLLFKTIDDTQKNQRKLLEHQANHDPLTQLPNRNFLLARFDDWKTRHKQFSLLFIDLDNFKGINDSYGHTVGDKLLITIAKRFQKILLPDQLLMRHGGDEFVLLIAADDSTSAETDVTEKAYQACNDIELDKKFFSPGMSIGIARFPEHGSSLEELLRVADIAMYEAKKIVTGSAYINLNLKKILHMKSD